MKTDPNIGFACTEEFAELCALATTGTLTPEESARLEKHIVDCRKCRDLLAEYHDLASVGMAKLGAEMATDERSELEVSWPHAEARSQLLETLRAGETVPEESAAGQRTRHSSLSGERRISAQALAVAAVLVLGVVGGYWFGKEKSGRQSSAATQHRTPSIEEQLREVEVQRDASNTELAASSKSIARLTDRANRNERELAELKVEKASVEAKAQQASATNKEQAESFANERSALVRRLEEGEQALKKVKEELTSVEDDRRKAQLRTASLETTIDQLSLRLRERDETAKRDEEFLASDRDVRELMGARQLYIADVFDVDQSGKKRKPFGRVFYTKGKSLIFYAFDLDQQPAYLNAKAPNSKTFEVWGSPGQDNAKPVSLGVFYMDSEANRRWVFKSDDPSVLAQVDAVFVTVESKDGTKKTPGGKPFLYAYLRTVPANHP